MTNPYEPHQEPAKDALPPVLLVKGKFAGGFWSVAAIGIVGGLLVVSGLWAGGITAILMPAIAWIGAIAALMFLLRGIHIEASTKVIASLLLAVPAYILYVPVCAFSAMLTRTLTGAEGYGPTFPGMVLASIVSFVGVLLLFAAGVRRRFRGRVDPEVSDDV